MRKRVRIVMLIVAAAFVAGFLLVPNLDQVWRALTGRGSEPGRDSRYVGRVGKHNITREEYRAALNYTTDKYKSDNRLRDLSNEDYQAVEQQTWKYIVTELTWAKVLNAARIRVTEEEIMEIISSNPPEELRENPELMTDGRFDPQKYMQIMNAPENREYFAKYFRQIFEMLPREKFRIDVINAYRPTNAEAQDALVAANTKWKTTALYFGPRVMKQRYEPTDAEVKAWYEANKDSFRTKETRQLRYVFFPLAISMQDSADAKEVIDRAHNQLLKGETFNLTALDFSDLEGETLSAMTPRTGLGEETDSVLARLKPGQHSSPFLVPFGWQIVRLDSAKKDSVAFRRIVVRVKLGSEVLAAVRDSVRSFVEMARVEGFDSVAARFGLAVRQPRPLIGDQKELAGLDVGSQTELIDWARRARPRQLFDLPLRGSQGYYVFELAEAKPAGYSEFEKVKQAVVYRVRREREKQAWLEAAEQALEQVRAGKSLEQYAAENPGVELQVDSCTGLVDCRRRKGPEFAGALVALYPGEKCGVVETSWGAFIIRCDERTEVAMLEPAAFLEQRRSRIGQELLNEMLEEPEIRDYRDALAY